MASRGHSALHAVIVLGNLWAFSKCGIWGDALANTCEENEFFFGITVGYFFFDFFVVVHYRMAFWQVFLVHHTAASLPYFINNYIPGAAACHFVLGLFIQVEIATLVLNYQNYLEVTERSHTKTYDTVFYAAYVLWFLTRICMPTYIAWMLVHKPVEIALQNTILVERTQLRPGSYISC